MQVKQMKKSHVKFMTDVRKKLLHTFLKYAAALKYSTSIPFGLKCFYGMGHFSLTTLISFIR